MLSGFGLTAWGLPPEKTRSQIAGVATGLAIGVGWSSPVARQAHNLKVGGSNPPPATNLGEAWNALGANLHHRAGSIPAR